MHGFYETVARSTAEYRKKEHTSNCTRIEEKRKKTEKIEFYAERQKNSEYPADIIDPVDFYFMHMRVYWKNSKKGKMSYY